MIRVNLLPMHLRPVRRSIIPYAIALLILIAGLAVMSMVYLVDQAKVLRLRTEVRTLDQQLEELQEVRDRYQELLDLKSSLQSKVETIEEITRDRIVWSSQLYNLSRLAPDNVWYSRIETDERSFRERQDVYDPKTKTTKRQEVTVSKPVLLLEGYVTKAPDGKANVNPLMRNLAEDEEFARLFEQESVAFMDEFFDNRFDVRKFEFEYIIEPEADTDE
jgi:Tfp pilus assembly protein PilN